MKKILRSSVLGLALIAMTGCGSSYDGIEAQAWDATFNGKALIVGARDLGYETYNGSTVVSDEEDVNPDLPSFKYTEVAKDDLTTKMTAALGANNPSQLPDIVQIEDYTAPSYLSKYSQYFYPVQNVGAKAEDFASVKAEPATYNNTLYGIPFDASPAIIAIEIKPLIEAGLVTDTTAELASTPTAIVSLEQMQGNDDAWTWNKFLALGEAATAIIKGKGTAEQKAAFDKYGVKNWIGLDKADIGHIRAIIQSAGEWYTTGNGADTKVTFKDNAAFAQALEITHILYSKTEVKDLASATDNYNNWDGNTLCGITASWITSSISNTESNKGNWCFVEMPILTTDVNNPDAPIMDNATHYSALGGSGFYVIDKGDKEQAEKAATYLYNAFGNIKNEKCEEIVNKLATSGAKDDWNTGIGSVLGVKGTENLSNYKAANTFFYNNQKTTEFFADVNQAPAVNFGDYTYDIENAIYETVYQYTSEKNTGSVTLKDTITAVQKAAEDRINK